MVFWILVILFLVLLWFLLSFSFTPIGKLFYRIWKDAEDEINNKKEEEKKEDE